MDSRKIIALILIIAGVIGITYGSFSYTKETHEAKVGPLSFAVSEKETINVPLWLSAAAMGAGILILVLGRKSK